MAIDGLDLVSSDRKSLAVDKLARAVLEQETNLLAGRTTEEARKADILGGLLVESKTVGGQQRS